MKRDFIYAIVSIMLIVIVGLWSSNNKKEISLPSYRYSVKELQFFSEIGIDIEKAEKERVEYSEVFYKMWEHIKKLEK